MNLGNFSISLAVADMAVSRAFYEALGFSQIAGDGEGWLILANGEAKIGLFYKMFEDNIITFNPPDARGVEAAMGAAGYAAEKPTEPGSGPTHCMLKDPDGNTILVDQHGDTPE